MLLECPRCGCKFIGYEQTSEGGKETFMCGSVLIEGGEVIQSRYCKEICDSVGKAVIYTGTSEEQIKWGNNDDPRDLLVIGKTYHIQRKEVHSWSTKLWLVEFPDKKFNSVCFDEVE